MWGVERGLGRETVVSREPVFDSFIEYMPECSDLCSEHSGLVFSESKSLSKSGSRQCSHNGDNDPDFDLDSFKYQGEEVL